MTLPNSYLNDLHSNICHVTFKKKDGSLRYMKCTLVEKYVPPQREIENEIQKKKANADVVAVFDLDKQEWRSFRKESVTEFWVEKNEYAVK